MKNSKAGNAKGNMCQKTNFTRECFQRLQFYHLTKKRNMAEKII